MISSLLSISLDLESIPRFRYWRVLAAGWFVRNSTTAWPERKEHLLRFRCVK